MLAFKMEGISKVMTGLTVLSILIISYTIFQNSQNISFQDPNKEYVDTFIFEPPLQKIVVNYNNPGQKNLEVETQENYRGTKISLGEYHFRLRANISNITYYFEFPESLIRENDVNPDTIELYTVINNEIVKAGGNKENNSIVLTTKKIVPILILADPNEATRVTSEELYYNSKSKASIIYDSTSQFFMDPKNQIIAAFIFLGLIMTIILIVIEQSRKPSKKSDNQTIKDYIDHVRSEGLSDEEIIAELVERGVKASQAAIIVRRK